MTPHPVTLETPAPAPTVLNVVCSWCKCILGVVDGQGVTGQSDGMCPACAEKVWLEYIAAVTA